MTFIIFSPATPFVKPKLSLTPSSIKTHLTFLISTPQMIFMNKTAEHLPPLYYEDTKDAHFSPRPHTILRQITGISEEKLKPRCESSKDIEPLITHGVITNPR